MAHILVHVTTVPETLNFFRGQIGYLKKQGFEVHAVSSPGELLAEVAGQGGYFRSCGGVASPHYPTARFGSLAKVVPAFHLSKTCHSSWSYPQRGTFSGNRGQIGQDTGGGLHDSRPSFHYRSRDKAKIAVLV